MNLFGYVDSVGKPSDTNLYAYVGNDPINWVDPFGLYVWGGNFGGAVTVRGMKGGRPPLSYSIPKAILL